MAISVANVYLWGENIGAVAWDDQRDTGTFEYEKKFVRAGLSPSPIHMPVSSRGDNKFTFPTLARGTFLGLPGMLADSLPDKYGHAMIDVWLAQQGRAAGSMNPVEKLLYIGSRGMGALEYRPAPKLTIKKARDIDLASLVELANEILQKKEKLDVSYADKDALISILQIGTSAGGARPKGIVAIHKNTKHIISGQGNVPKGYEHWIVKFDGVSDIGLGDPKSFGRIEYAYYLMAKAAGINMTKCKLWEEGGRAHFMTRRFDRVGNEKLHMQSLCGLAHYDFNMARHYSYEQAMMVAQQISLRSPDIKEMYRRMVFNVITRNQDDHTKNISFLMGKDGRWRLAPAYDVTYSFNPIGEWTNRHQMLINNKAGDFVMGDLISAGEKVGVKNGAEIIEEVQSAAGNWLNFASDASVPREQAKEILGHFRFLAN